MTGAALGGRAAALVVGSLLATLAATAGGAELDDGGGDAAVQVHGFVSQGGVLSTGNNYLAQSKRGSLEFAELGVNFTTQLTDRLRVGLQLFARDLGPLGTYSAKADWFYLDYRWRDWFGIRAGRVKLPFGLYNDLSDIDAGRVAVLLPQSVYPITSRDFLLAQTGVELYGYVDLANAGSLDYRVYGGTIYIDPSTNPAIKGVDVPYVAGGRVLWETPVQGLRVGGSLQALRLALKYAVDPTMPPIPAALDAVLAVASVELTRRDLTVAAEFSQWRLAIDREDLMFFPGQKQVTVSERAYVLATYHVTPWLWPGVYYSMLFPDEANATFGGASQDMQHDVAGTLRFDINPHWLFKLEGHYMHGTAGADPTLNAGALRDVLTRDWVVLLAKTTAYF